MLTSNLNIYNLNVFRAGDFIVIALFSKATKADHFKNISVWNCLQIKDFKPSEKDSNKMNDKEENIKSQKNTSQKSSRMDCWGSLRAKDQ